MVPVGGLAAMGRPAVIVHGGAGRRSRVPDRREPGLRRAVDAAWSVLEAGGDALEAAVAAVVVLEDDPCFNAGIGAVRTSAGTVELDASVMRGSDLAAGAVALVRRCRNPVLLARALVERPEVLIAGPATIELAERTGVPLVSEAELERAGRGSDESRGETVGAVVLDLAGHVAAATSTGGRAGKPPGRIGDSAIVGAGTYADDEAGAASATGFGETMMRLTVARAAVDRLRDGIDPLSAARGVLRCVQRRLPSDVGLILVDHLGRLGAACAADSMPIAWRCGDQAILTADAAALP